jgi:phosphomannomutase
VSQAVARSTSSPAVVLPADRRPRRARAVRRREARLLSTSRARRRRRSPASRSRGRRSCRPTTGSSGSSPTGSWLLVRTSGTEPLVRVYTRRRPPSCATTSWSTGERLVRGQ